MMWWTTPPRTLWTPSSDKHRKTDRRRLLMMRRIKPLFALLLALVLTVGALPVRAAAAGTGFTDVPSGAYYADAVEWAVEEGITQGTGNGAFSPKKTVTRAEAVTFLWRAAGSPSPATAASGFRDVADKNAYYYKAVLWAVEEGITNGVGDSRFNPAGKTPPRGLTPRARPAEGLCRGCR